KIVQITRLPIRPIGMLRWGFLVSSAAVDTASKPTYAKNIEAAAPPMPSQPNGANGAKFSALMTGSASAQNSTKAATLMQTSTAFTVALSRSEREQRGDERRDEHGGHIDEPAREVALGQIQRDVNVEAMRYQRHEVIRPPHRHGARRDGVFENERPAD